MPFNYLLWHSIQLGESISQNSVTAVCQRKDKDNEIILIFKTDCEEYKRKYHSDRAVCDAIFYYKNLAEKARNIVLVFVELGGSKSDHSVTQLEETVKTVTKKLQECGLRKITSCYALAIYSSGSSPKNLQSHQKRFNDHYRTRLEVKQDRRVDLRKHFRF